MVIVNIDECGTDTHGKRWTHRGVVKKGVDSAFAPVNGERGEHISLVMSVCSDGTYVPPTVVLPGANNYTPEQLRRYPKNTTVTSTSNGWSNEVVFLGVLESVLRHVESLYPDWAGQSPLLRQKVLILVDGHSSHDSIDILKFCLLNSLIMVGSPAHCTHIVQILDSHQLLGAFQNSLRGHILRSSMNGAIVDVKNFGRALSRALEDVFEDPGRIKRVFREYGVFPLDHTALCTDKMRQHAAIQEAEYYRQHRRAGMDDEAAREAARAQMITPTIEYDEQWKKDIVTYFVNQVGEPPEVQDPSLRSTVCKAIVEVQRDAHIATQVDSSAVATVKRRRKVKALNNQAVIMTREGRLEAMEQKEDELKIQEDESSQKKLYDAKRKWEISQLDKLRAERKEALAEAKANLKKLKKRKHGVSEWDIEDAQQAVEDLTTEPNPPAWKKYKRLCREAEGEDMPVPQVLQRIDHDIDEGNTFAAKFPQAFQALLEGNMMTNVSLVVHQHQTYQIMPTYI